MSLMDLSPLLCPDKADRYQDLTQELTGQPRRFISGKKKKKPSCFIIEREEGKMIVGRLLYWWVEKGTQCEADDDIQYAATESVSVVNRQVSLPLQPHFEDEFLRE